MLLVNGLCALVIAAAPAASGPLATAAAAPGQAGRQAAGTQCRADETVLYSCRFGGNVGSVCAARGRVHYRYGPRGRPEIDLASADDWNNIHVGHVVGQGGGHQSHVRFSAGRYHYIVFEGVNGSLADSPGRRHSGIHVGAGADGREQLAYHQCRSRPVLAGSWSETLHEHAPPPVRAAGVAPEEPGGPFDGWF